MASSSSKSSNAGDSYLGSYISLISNYEIRYEGILYHLNVQDSTIALKNVRSYGTEGRKQDGPQIPPSDKVYEFILFRGSDIQDLQVKAAPPAQREEPVHDDPAIIQSHYAGVPLSYSTPASVDAPANGQNMPVLINGSYSTSYPSSQSVNQVVSTSLSQATESTAQSFSMQNYWQEYSGTSINKSYAPHNSIPFQPPPTVPSSLSVQNQMQTPVHSTRSMSNGVSPYVASTSSPLPTPTQSLITPDQLAQSTSHVLYSMAYPDQKNMDFLTPLSSTSPPTIPTLASQSPLLPSPRSARKHKQLTVQFTEEFDFEAMNEKFKKEEVWGYLGKPNRTDKTVGIEDNGTDQSMEDKVTLHLLPKFDPKPAYRKDDFFDSISCNSLSRGRNGQNHFSDQMKLDTETFRRSNQSPNFGYASYGTSRGTNNHGRINWRREYGYGGRGNGNLPF